MIECLDLHGHKYIGDKPVWNCVVWSGTPVLMFGSVLELFGNAVLSPGNQNIMIFIELEEC